MGEYADVKIRQMVRLLNWLATKPSITIKTGGNHQFSVKHTHWDRPFPIPFKHSSVNKHIVKALMEKLVASEVCTKEEFDGRL